MVHNEYVFDPYPLTVTIQRFELKHAISLESYVKLAKAFGYSEEIMQLLAQPNIPQSASICVVAPCGLSSIFLGLPLFTGRTALIFQNRFATSALFCNFAEKSAIMEVNIDQTKWYDRIWAAFIFFTRLPFWRLHQPPKACYATMVEHWPLTGWLTGGVMAATLYLSCVLAAHPVYPVAVVLAIVARLFLTGALHEDGLADFLDGFGGGGNDRQRILDIMKDSHIGTYGVLGLGCYLLLLFCTLNWITPEVAALTIFAADPYSKMLASELIIMMPYARKEEEAKSRTVYRKISAKAAVSLAFQGFLPLALLIFLTDVSWEVLIFIPAIVMYFLYLLIWRKLRGYTGDCCGAVCLLVELTFYIVACLQNPQLTFHF